MTHLMILGYYLGKPSDSCERTCKNLGNDFACTFMLTFQNSTKEFHHAIDGYNYTKVLDIPCNVSDQSSLFNQPDDPSFLTDNGLCRGFRNIPNKIDCMASADNNTRRLCRCLDKGDFVWM